MFIITLAAVVPDFFNATGMRKPRRRGRCCKLKQTSLGIPAIFAVAKQFKTTTGEVNNLSHKYVICTVATTSSYP